MKAQQATGPWAGRCPLEPVMIFEWFLGLMARRYMARALAGAKRVSHSRD
jgi:hypothetical protein